MEQLFISNNSHLLTSPTTPSSQVESTTRPAELYQAVLLILCCVLGIPGNIAVLMLLLRKLEKKNFTHLLMLNLACCDLLCLITLPVWTVDKLKIWEINYSVCKFISFLTFCSLYANIFTITLMSIQRFVKVLHHHRWAQIGTNGERALLLGLWGMSCFLTWPSVASFGMMKEGHFVCNRPPQMEGQTLAATVVELLLGFIVPFSVMTSFYSCLYRKVKETALSSNKRTSQLISRIIITFLFLWIPNHIVAIVGLVGALLHTSHPDVTYKVEQFTDEAKMVYIFPLFSSVIDPFLYAYSVRKIWPRKREGEDCSASKTKMCDLTVKSEDKSLVGGEMVMENV